MSRLVQVSHLDKEYGEAGGRLIALRDVSLSIAAREFVALRGPSGCGKSTLLHIIGAMDIPSRGRVVLGGRELQQLSRAELAKVRRREVGFIFQAFNLLPALSALENVALPLLLDGAVDQEALHAAEAVLKDVGLADKVASFPGQLSGGEMQRVAIARAVVIRPQLLVADEPTGSLDSANGERILELLAELNRSRQLTVVLATHSNEAASYASRSLHLRDGQLENADQAHVISTNL